MVLLREYNIYNDILKFKIGDTVKITIPGENFWTTIKTISKTTGYITATIENKLITPYRFKTIKFNVKNILDVWKNNIKKQNKTYNKISRKNAIILFMSNLFSHPHL